MKNDKKKVAIIGGGASGVFSGILLSSSKDIDVTIFEKQNRILKKLLQTGNGMCNITNSDCDNIDNYNTDLIKDTLIKFNHNKELEIFSDLGLLIKEETEGRCYPYSKKASTVFDIFDRALKNNNVNVHTDIDVKDIKCENGYKLITNKGNFAFDYVIVSTGSKSNIGFDYDMYNILKKNGFNIVKPRPSLVGFKTVENIKPLSGIRFKASVKLVENDKVKEIRSGEVQFKDDGVSGIVIMELSRLYNRDAKTYISLDLMSDYTEDELTNIIANNVSKYHSLDACIMGMLPKMMVLDIVKKAEDINSVVKLIKNYKLNIKDTYDFNQSQVTRGGVDLNDVNLATYESKNKKNMYLIGEVLDVDGNCGGYNLHFAFASAYVASMSILEKVRG